MGGGCSGRGGPPPPYLQPPHPPPTPMAVAAPPGPLLVIRHGGERGDQLQGLVVGGEREQGRACRGRRGRTHPRLPPPSGRPTTPSATWQTIKDSGAQRAATSHIGTPTRTRARVVLLWCSGPRPPPRVVAAADPYLVHGPPHLWWRPRTRGGGRGTEPPPPVVVGGRAAQLLPRLSPLKPTPCGPMFMGCCRFPGVRLCTDINAYKGAPGAAQSPVQSAGSRAGRAGFSFLSPSVTSALARSPTSSPPTAPSL